MARIVSLMVVLLVFVSPVRAVADPLSPGTGPIQAGGDWRCSEVNGDVELNVRAGAGMDYRVTSTVAPDTQIEADYSQVESADGYNWVPVRADSGEGWAVTLRLSPCPADYSDPQDHVVLDGVNQDGVLDRFEIAAIAPAVVLLANVEGNNITATGTGTIITPDGLILTNAHVVEDADLVGVALLNDINDPPDYQYIGQIVRADNDLDVALVAIRYTLDGRPLRADELNLPYIPISVRANEVYRGDTLTIFGYPGIGDDYLVVTGGSVVSVENGSINGQRIPVWYRTDAEIAPGNSGGLVVNGNGEFIGIPTDVISEAETGGRLGGIRPAQVALLVVEENADSSAVAQPQNTPKPPAQAGEAVIRFTSVRAEHGVEVDGESGIRIHVAFDIDQWAGKDAVVRAAFYYDDPASTPLINPVAPAIYRDTSNNVQVSVPINPCCDETVYDDLPLFIPYTALGLTEPGDYPLKYHLEVESLDQSWRQTLSWEYFTLTVR